MYAYVAALTKRPPHEQRIAWAPSVDTQLAELAGNPPLKAGARNAVKLANSIWPEAT